MKITLLTQYYPPETGAAQSRLADLARRLRNRGHFVQVLTALPNYPNDRILPEYVGKENTVEDLDGIRVARVGLYVPRRRTVMRRLINYLTFAFNARLNGMRLLKRSDIVFLELPPLFLAPTGVALARRLGAKLVTNVADLWPKVPIQLGVKVPAPARRILEWLEEWIYRKSDMIFGQTEGIVQDIRERFPDKSVKLFPNGVDVDRYRVPLERERFRREFGWSENTIVIGYTGTFAMAHAHHQIIEAALIIQKKRPDIHFAFFGDGMKREEIERLIRDKAVQNVRMYGYWKNQSIPHIQSAFDVAIVPMANIDENRRTRPAKMFELMAAGLPIVLCGEGEAADILLRQPEKPVGVVVPPEQPELLADALLKLVADKQAMLQLGVQARDFVFKHFDRQMIADNLESELLRLCAERIAH